jgi:hypothetical protein
VIGDLQKCKENDKQRQVSYEQASLVFSEHGLIYMEVDTNTFFNLPQLHSLIIERFHQKALVKNKNLRKEQSRSYKCNKAINCMLTLLSCILLLALIILLSFLMYATCITITDKIFKA